MTINRVSICGLNSRSGTYEVLHSMAIAAPQVQHGSLGYRQCWREGLCPDGQMTSENLLFKLSKMLGNNWKEVFYSYFFI